MGIGVLSAALLGGCSPAPAGRSAGASPAPPVTLEAAKGGVIPAEKVKACAGFSAETAAGLLGVPAGQLVDRSSDVYDKLRSCSFLDPKQPGVGVTFSLRRDDSVEDAAQEMASFRDHLGVAQRVLPEPGGSSQAAAEEVPGLGDEAVWARVNGTLNVREGNVTIQVAQPADRELQKRVAEEVLAGLG